MEILRRPIETYKEIGSDCVSIKVENDCIVPDVKPDVAEIILATGSIAEISAKPYTDRVVLSGQVSYRVVYGSENGGYDSMWVPADFTTTIWMQGATADSVCLVKGAVADTECRLINSRKVNMHSQVELCVEIIGSDVVTLSTSPQGQREMELISGTAELLQYSGDLHFSRDLVWTLEAPQGGDLIENILYYDISVREMDTALDYDRLMFKGAMELSVLYTGAEGNTLQVLTRQTDFEIQGDARGLLPESNLRLNTNVLSTYAQILNDQDGEPTIVELGATLAVDGVAGMVETVEYVKDGYSREQPVCSERSDLGFVSRIWQSREIVSLTEELVLSESKIGEVIGLWAHTDNLSAVAENGSVNISGNVVFKLLYGEQGTHKLMGACFTVPISVIGEFQSTTPVCHVNGIVRNLSWTLNGPLRLGVKYSIAFDLCTCHREDIRQVNGFAPNPAGFPGNFSCGMLVYYPQKGETAWDVAARYMVSVQELMELNGMEGEDLPERIFLPGKTARTNI